LDESKTFENNLKIGSQMKLLNYIGCFALLLALTVCSFQMKEAVTSSELVLERVLEQIPPARLMDYVQTLAGEKYAGRLTGTIEYRAAARWLAGQFKELGLQPPSRSGDYLVSFPNPYTVIFVGGELAYLYGPSSRPKKRKFIYEKEYYPGSQSADGAITAEVVYVGYGITAPELNYDDYRGVNVRGKIVFVEPGAPVSYEDNPEEWPDWQAYVSPRYKIKMAVAHGARGMLFNRLEINPDIDYVPGFRVAQVGEAVTKVLFARTGRTHQATLQKIKQSRQPQSFRTRKRFRIENFSEHYPRGKGYNVLGLLPGNDPLLAQEYILVGAHLDGVGFCYEVVPGANDNASGIAVLLGIAEALTKSQVKLKRSILFVGWGGTEQGNRGVENYLSRPIVSLKKTVLYLNLDEVGRGEYLRVRGALDYPYLWKYFDRQRLTPKAVQVSPTNLVDQGWPRRDALFFKKKRIPALDFQVSGRESFIHTPQDKPERLSPEILVQLVKWLSLGLKEAANAESLLPKDKK